MRITPYLSAGLAVMALALPSWAADGEKYLPNSSEGVITIDVKLLLNSAIAKRNLEQIKPLLKADENFQKTVDALGLDPFKDIETILIGAPGGGDMTKAVAVVQGKFNSKKIHAFAEKAAKDNPEMVKIEKVGNDSLYQITPPGRNEKTNYAALLDDTTLVGSGSRDMVVEAMEKKSGKKKGELKKDLAALLGKANTKQAIRFALLEAIVGQGDLAGQVKTATGGITVGEDIKIEITLNAKDDKAAATVSDKIDEGLRQAKQFVGLIALKEKKAAPLIDVVNTFEVKAQDTIVSIKGEVSKSVVEKLEKLAKEGAGQ
jgi:hypothetical protein